jgi:hypothetical protein
MGQNAALWWFITLSIALFSGAVCAALAWRWASASTRHKKQAPLPPSTAISETRFAAIEADQAELFSTLQKLTTTVKRLSSRAGMELVRDRQSGGPPPPGTPKAELRRYYSVNPGQIDPRTLAQHSQESDNG